MNSASALKALKFLSPVYDSAVYNEVVLRPVLDSTKVQALFDRMLKEKSIEVASPDAIYNTMITLNVSLAVALKTHFYGADGKSVEAFATCKSKLEIFNRKQTIENEIAILMHRFGYVVNEEGVALLQDVPRLQSLEKIIKPELETGKLIFVPFRTISFHITANIWAHKGVEIIALNRMKIRPLAGVWSPITQDYINMMASYVDSERITGDALDIGSGTGVLALVLASKGMNVTAIDINPDAVECTNINAENLGFSSIRTIHADITSPPPLPQYDLIVSNPPWLPFNSSRILFQGPFDINEQMLKGSISFARLNLKPSGRLLLLYNDLAELIGIHAPGRIAALCKENGLRIAKIESKKDTRKVELYDPLRACKEASHFLLYDIRLA